LASRSIKTFELGVREGVQHRLYIGVGKYVSANALLGHFFLIEQRGLTGFVGKRHLPDRPRDRFKLGSEVARPVAAKRARRLENELRRRNSSEQEIRQGIADDGFIPFFQPIVDLASRKVTGFEVLARWQRADGEILEPEQFISGAEAAGVIAELSFSVMRKALKIARDWPADCRIAVNISPVQFKDPFLAQRILLILTEAGFPAQRLELEITESSLIGDHEQAMTTIASLRNCGARIVIDDFGIGYASLGQLRSFPFDRIKIDRSFVSSLLVDRQCDAIVQSILTLGERLQIPTTAEGVESEDVCARLLSLGCRDAQGWLFAKALSADHARELMASSVDGPSYAHAPVVEQRAAG